MASCGYLLPFKGYFNKEYFLREVCNCEPLKHWSLSSPPAPLCSDLSQRAIGLTVSFPHHPGDCQVKKNKAGGFKRNLINDQVGCPADVSWQSWTSQDSCSTAAGEELLRFRPPGKWHICSGKRGALEWYILPSVWKANLSLLYSRKMAFRLKLRKFGHFPSDDHRAGILSKKGRVSSVSRGLVGVKALKMLRPE